ncbi:aminotransferase class V-fold PLP-dependent enzyme [Tengunoibacter tsumagoiensis]|uniref:Cysteine lyase n=1 Tax=Tengunoibacter tsumagoiensis TaxID=2014871 RepID=A0A402A9K6_9CHLR|nr:aminotransferase class V-fold PLP-dependent enzyme [Tengunoibacter tsumagoiensis]GCE15809.1 cysteine lyase [Tengunoibacter tsumagoiensis]
MINTHVDMAEVRQQLPSLEKHIYMNTAAFGPLLRCAPQAMASWLETEATEGRLGLATYEPMGKLYTETRSTIARLINADVDEIALTGNTGEGLNIICNGFDWQPGDEIIMTNHEHISAIILMYYLRDRYGVVLQIADLGPRGDQPADEAIAALITPRTRLIVISHVSFMTGAVIDIPVVTALGRKSNVPVLVDGAQAVGVLPVDVKALGADFYAFPMQKWLCGPDGTGSLYVRRELLSSIHPTYVGGWFSLKFEALRKWDFHPSAQRYELGGRHSSAVAGQLACLRWLEEKATYPWIFERTSALNSAVYAAVQDLPGVGLLTPQPGASGLLTFTLEDCEMGELAQWLQQEYSIYARAIHEYNALRISTGFYNTEEEVATLSNALHQWRKS